MVGKVKANASAVPVPQSAEEVATAIAAIGEHQRQRTEIETAMNAELAATKLRCEALAKRHAEAITALSKGVQTWCEANRAALTGNGRTKTYRFASGSVSWRLTPPKVTLRDVEAVIKALKSKGLDLFLRIKEEVDKEAILKTPEKVKGIRGITIGQGEEFVIEPFEAKLEEVA